MSAESEKKQLNFGLVDEVVVQKILAKTEEFTSTLMNDGYGKLNKKQFMADFSEVFLGSVTKWVSTGMSAGESKREATREIVRERFNEDINAKVKEFMIEINKIIADQVEKVLVEYYGPPPPSS
jgi:hypothetical protein